jgi:hypothetical protein
VSGGLVVVVAAAVDSVEEDVVVDVAAAVTEGDTVEIDAVSDEQAPATTAQAARRISTRRIASRYGDFSPTQTTE